MNIGSVEVHLGTRRVVISSVDYTELRVRVWASFSNVIDVEARVDFDRSSVDVIELVAGGLVRGIRIREDREGALRRRELELRVPVVRIVALVLTLPQLVQKGPELVRVQTPRLGCLTTLVEACSSKVDYLRFRQFTLALNI